MGCSTPFPSEQDLVASVIDNLQAKGIACYREVPCLSHSIDVLAEAGELHAIECKLRNWKAGIRQARYHTLAVDFVHLCLPATSLTFSAVLACIDTGVGLIAALRANGALELVQVVAPARSREKSVVVEQRVRQTIGRLRSQGPGE